MISLDSVSTEVFQILRSYDFTMKLYDDSGNQVHEADEARRFCSVPDNLLVSVTDSGSSESINLYIGASKDYADVLGLAETLRTTATKFNMVFNMKRRANDVNEKDFATLFSVTESEGDNNMDLLEGMYGTSKSSYLKLENARLIVRHSRKIDETVVGSRGRHVDNIFIENARGERFLFPTRQMAPARAMAQHVNQGGHWADAVGEQISRMAQDYSALAGGSAYIGYHSGDLTEVAHVIRDHVRDTMREMRESFRRLYKPTSYVSECEKLGETSKMVTECDADKVYALEKVKEALYVDGVELEEGVVNAIAEALRGKTLVEFELDPVSDDLKKQNSASNGFIISVKGRYVGTNGLVDEKGEATTFPSAVRAAAYADRMNIKGYDVVNQHASIENTVPETLRVMGRNVSVDAWNKLVGGEIDLMSPVTVEHHPRFAPDAKDTELSFKVGAIVPHVSDDSILNLLSYISENLPEDNVPEKTKSAMRALAKHVINIAYPKNDIVVTEQVKDFIDWINDFSINNVLSESGYKGRYMDREEQEDHSDAVIVKSEEIEWVIDKFDADDFLKWAASDLNWWPGEEDPMTLHIEDRTFERSYVEGLVGGYLSKELEKNASIYDEDMDRYAPEVSEAVIEKMRSAGFVIEDRDVPVTEDEGTDLTMDDVVIPVDGASDLENEVSVRGVDSEYVQRLKTLAGRR